MYALEYVRVLQTMLFAARLFVLGSNKLITQGVGHPQCLNRSILATPTSKPVVALISTGTCRSAAKKGETEIKTNRKLG